LGGSAPKIYQNEERVRGGRRVISEMLRGAAYGMFNLHTLFVMFLSVLATFVSSPGVLDLRMDTWVKMITLGAVYPTVNTVKASYARREKSLQWLASLKGSIVGYVWMMREFSGGGQHELLEICCRNGEKLTQHLNMWMQIETYDKQFHMKEVYKCVSNFSFLVFCATAHCPPPPNISLIVAQGIISRMNQYVRLMIFDVEKMRTIRDYRTPNGLRMFAAFVLHLSCITLGPFFNSYCKEGEEYGCPGSYFTSIMFCTVVLMLYHTQRDLEDPYDGIGVDDINMERIPREIGFVSRAPLYRELTKHEGIIPPDHGDVKGGLSINKDYQRRTDARATNRYSAGSNIKMEDLGKHFKGVTRGPW